MQRSGDQQRREERNVVHAHSLRQSIDTCIRPRSVSCSGFSLYLSPSHAFPHLSFSGSSSPQPVQKRNSAASTISDGLLRDSPLLVYFFAFGIVALISSDKHSCGHHDPSHQTCQKLLELSLAPSPSVRAQRFSHDLSMTGRMASKDTVSAKIRRMRGLETQECSHS